MGIVLDYNEPRDAQDMARIIAVFLTDQFSWGYTGGIDEDGGDLVYEQPKAESVRITVADAHDKYESRDDGRRSVPDPGAIRESLARYFAASRRLGEVETAAKARRELGDAPKLDEIVGHAASRTSEARDVLISLVRSAHGLAPGDAVTESIALDVAGTILAIPADSGEADHPLTLTVIPSKAVAVVTPD